MSNRSAHFAFFGLGALALATCVVVLSARPGRRLTAAQLPVPSFTYVVPWSNDYDPQTQALYQNLSNAIAGFNGVPNARWAYYSYYNDGVNWSIGSWGGGVCDAVPDGNGGYNVKVLVGPNISMSPQGSGTPMGQYFEIFNVDANGDVTFVSSNDLEGWGGGQLVEISY